MGTGLYPGAGAATGSLPSGREEAALLGHAGHCNFWHLAGNVQGEHPSSHPVGDAAARDRVAR